MKKQNRIRKSEQFKFVLDQRHLAYKCESFSLFYAYNKLNYARIGLSVSSKIGDAVVRNRIKRQLRAQVNQLDIITMSLDIVIIAREAYPKKTFQENLAYLKSALKKIPSRPKKGKIDERKTV